MIAAAVPDVVPTTPQILYIKFQPGARDCDTLCCDMHGDLEDVVKVAHCLITHVEISTYQAEARRSRCWLHQF